MKVFSKQDLIDFSPKHKTLVAIDSDGCVFDTMEEKQLNHFLPNVIKCFGLESVQNAATDCVKFVWLYSRTRGLNRFANLFRFFERLKTHPEFIDSSIELFDTTSLKNWIESGQGLSNLTLKKYVAENPDPCLEKVLKWSLAVNASTDVMAPIPPFEFALKSLKKLHEKSDALVVSQTMDETLVAEWDLHNLTQYVDLIAGPAIGTKAEALKLAMKDHFDPKSAIIMGDALGDLQAAQACGIWFYPILPANEEASWRKFYEEDYDRFVNGDFDDNYQKLLIDEFLELLPEKPYWEK